MFHMEKNRAPVTSSCSSPQRITDFSSDNYGYCAVSPPDFT